MDYDTVYSRLIILNALLPYYLLRGTALYPCRVQLEVTYSCNLSCQYCYQDSEYKKEKEELTLEEIKHILSQIPRFSLVTLSGGEPFYRKDFPDILRHALSNHWCNLLSNCALMSKEDIHQMVDGGLLLLGASIDGVGELHDELRGGKVFGKIIDNLRYLQQYKRKRGKRFPLLDVKTVILPQNVSNLTEVYQLADELGADYLTLSLPKVSEVQFNPRLFGDINNPVFYKKNVGFGIERHTLEKSLSEIYRLSARSGMKIRFYPRVQDIHEFDVLFNNTVPMAEKYAACFEPWSGINISANGRAYPCLSYHLGSIRDATVIQIWNSPRYRAFRNRLRGLKLFPACEGCCYLRVNRADR